MVAHPAKKPHKPMTSTSNLSKYQLTQIKEQPKPRVQGLMDSKKAVGMNHIDQMVSQMQMHHDSTPMPNKKSSQCINQEIPKADALTQQQSYPVLSDYYSTDEEGQREIDEKKKEKFKMSWGEKGNLTPMVNKTEKMDPVAVFGNVEPITFTYEQAKEFEGTEPDKERRNRSMAWP